MIPKWKLSLIRLLTGINLDTPAEQRAEQLFRDLIQAEDELAALYEKLDCLTEILDD